MVDAQTHTKFCLSVAGLSPIVKVDRLNDPTYSPTHDLPFTIYREPGWLQPDWSLHEQSSAQTKVFMRESLKKASIIYKSQINFTYIKYKSICVAVCVNILLQVSKNHSHPYIYARRLYRTGKQIYGRLGRKNA